MFEGLINEHDVDHIPFTWGTGWKDTIDAKNKKYQFRFIIASDILLYVR